MRPDAAMFPNPGLNRGWGTSQQDGSAVIEFIGLAVVIMIPLTYLMITVFTVQRAVFAAGAAAREAGRAFALADSEAQGEARARTAADLALESHGLSGGSLEFHSRGSSCSSPAIAPTLEPGASYTVCLRLDIDLPYADKGYLADSLRAAAVTGKYTLVVDSFRRSR